jgi:hypothetical protein
MAHNTLSTTRNTPLVRSFIAAGIISSLVQVSLALCVRAATTPHGGHLVNRLCLLFSCSSFLC